MSNSSLACGSLLTIGDDEAFQFTDLQKLYTKLYPGSIRQVERGAVNAQITSEVAPGINIVSIITNDAVEDMKLAEGNRAYAIIKV